MMRPYRIIFKIVIIPHFSINGALKIQIGESTEKADLARASQPRPPVRSVQFQGLPLAEEVRQGSGQNGSKGFVVLQERQQQQQGLPGQ